MKNKTFLYVGLAALAFWLYKKKQEQKSLPAPASGPAPGWVPGGV